MSDTNTTPELKQTPLFAAHQEAGAKMVDFGGWHMPVQYEGIKAEHAEVRDKVGLFDVSHMGEIDFRGPGAATAVDTLITNDLLRIEDGKALYTALCHPHGGIVDDCIVYRLAPEHLRIVVNASNIDKDEAHFREQVKAAGIEGCEIENRSDEFALIAVQGPKARALVAGLSGNEAEVMDIAGFGLGSVKLGALDLLAARTGYTGEDGFELFVPAEAAGEVWGKLVAAGGAPIGLGARDTLRLEARLCLYGNDITDETTPLEAGLGWTVKLNKIERGQDFVGREALAKQKAEGVTRKLVGFKVTERGIARHGAEVVDAEGLVVGHVTSGGPSPTLGYPVGMAYVPTEMAGPGKTITIQQRKRTFQAELVKGPFYRREA